MYVIFHFPMDQIIPRAGVSEAFDSRVHKQPHLSWSMTKMTRFIWFFSLSLLLPTVLSYLYVQVVQAHVCMLVYVLIKLALCLARPIRTAPFLFRLFILSRARVIVTNTPENISILSGFHARWSSFLCTPDREQTLSLHPLLGDLYFSSNRAVGS